MQFSLNRIKELVHRITVEIPAVTVERKMNQKLKDSARKLKIPGFRKGKVPIRLIKDRYGKNIRQEVISDILSDSLRQAIKESDVKPVNLPKIKVLSDNEGEQLKFSATFEIMPDVQLIDMSKYKFTKIEGEVTEQDVDNMVLKLRKQHTNWLESIQPAAKENLVKIDFSGEIDGKKFDGSVGKDVSFVIGDGQMLKSFESGVIGMKLGDEKEIVVNFPENYHKELANKKAIFTVKLKQVFLPKIPEINGDFLKKFHIHEGGVEKFKDNIRSNMLVEMKQKILSLFKEDVFSKFVEAHNIHLPESLVQKEIKMIRDRAISNEKSKKTPIKPEDFPDELFIDQARKNTALSILIYKFTKEKRISLNHQKLKQRIEELSSSHDNPKQITEWIYSNNEQLSQIKSSVLEEQILEEITKETKIELKKLSYNEIMRQ